MLFVSLFVLASIAYLDHVLGDGRLELVDLRLRYRLFKLRDALRRDLIEGSVKDSSIFRYLDTTISRTIARSETVNIWDGTALVVHYDTDGQLQRFIRNRNRMLGRKENAQVASRYYEYTDIIETALCERHAASLTVAKHVREVVHRTSRNLKKINDVFSAAPETSTLREYGSSLNSTGSLAAQHRSDPHLTPALP